MLIFIYFSKQVKGRKAKNAINTTSALYVIVRSLHWLLEFFGRVVAFHEGLDAMYVELTRICNFLNMFSYKFEGTLTQILGKKLQLLKN